MKNSEIPKEGQIRPHKDLQHLKMKEENVIETQIDPVKAALHQDQVDDPLRGGKNHQVDDLLRDVEHHQGQASDHPKRGEAERFLEFHPSAPPHQREVATRVNLNLTINIRSMVAVLLTVFIFVTKKQQDFYR